MKPILLSIVLTGILANASDFSKLDNCQVPSVESSTVSWQARFIHPNELEPGNFHSDDLLSLNGLLVSVGTIRTLIIFSWAPHISHLLMSDIDNEVVNFNRAHLRHIKDLSERHPESTISQRIVYMANLLGYEPTNEEIERWAHNRFSYTEIKNKIIEESLPLRAFKQENRFMREAFHQKWTNEHFELGILFGYQRVNQEKFYWEDDEQWKKIVKALNENKIAITNLSVTRELAKIKTFSRDLGVEIGAIDVSNIPGSVKFGSSLQWAEQMKELRVGKVIYTKSLGYGNKFSYHCADPNFLSLEMQFGIPTHY